MENKQEKSNRAKHIRRILIIAVLLIPAVFQTYYLIMGVWATQDLSPSEEYIVVTEPKLVSEPISKEHLSKDAIDMVRFIMHRNYKMYQGMAEEIAIATTEASEEFGVPATILLAVMDIESDYRYDAVSKATAVGLMQVHVATWLDEKNKDNLAKAGIASSKKELFNPSTNIRAGAYILQLYMLEGMRKKVTNPVQYAATRYFGGEKNTYYSKLIAALGEYQIFNYKTEVEEANKRQDSDSVVTTDSTGGTNG